MTWEICVVGGSSSFVFLGGIYNCLLSIVNFVMGELERMFITSLFSSRLELVALYMSS